LGGFGYTGEQADSETGLVYLRARHYDPATGRFLQQDPAGLAGSGVNPYAYVGNTPTAATDPSGMFLDTLLDLGFIAYDLYQLATGGREHLGENLVALGLDTAGAALPFATGLGEGYRLARLAE